MITEYKETSIGRIPKDWEVIGLGKAGIVGMLAGYAFSSMFFNGEKGVPLIRIRDLGKESTEALYNGPYDDEYLVSPGEILIGMDGEFKAYKWRGSTGLLNQRVLKTWSKNEDYLDSLYLYYALQKPLRIIELQVGQTTVKHLSTKHFDRMNIPLPPIAEQRRIAEVLSSVDCALRLVDEAIAKTERLKKGLKHKLLTEGIGHKEFKQTQIGRIPKTWKVGRLSDYADVRYGLGQPTALDPNGIPMIRATNVKKGKIVETNLIRLEKSQIPSSRNPFLIKGEIIVVRSGVYTGDVTVISKKWEGAVAGYDLVVSPHQEIDSLFLTYWLLSFRIQNKYFYD